MSVRPDHRVFATERDVAGIAEMWQVALHRAWCDATGEEFAGATGRKGVPRNARHIVRSSQLVDEARQWFGTEDFYVTCALAGLDGRAVLDRYRAVRRGSA